MLKPLLVLLLLLTPSSILMRQGEDEEPVIQMTALSDTYQLYTEMNLDSIVDYTLFEQAMEGYNLIKEKKKEMITLIDFTKPSTEERLYVLDLRERKMIHSSLVAHGKNSGELYATSFSNKYGSYKSSLGFYLTENTYMGRNGYSLILEGLEKGINDRARERAIVVHGASYSNPSVISSSGRLGRSLGCPALPENMNEKIIDTIKGGSLLFIYANDEKYLSKSNILNKQVFG